jgi:SAM-dependent methyltransferase
MTPLALAPPPAALVFDQMANEYDDVFTKSMIGRAQRDVVWNKLTQVFQSGDHILELNCGTGEDALFLARNGVSVTACDASQQMIKVASTRLRAEAPGAPITFNILPTERLRELHSTPLFDGAFSNFSGLNCVTDLKQTADDLATLLFPGASLLVCLSTRFCLWEMLWLFYTETSARPSADVPDTPPPKQANSPSTCSIPPSATFKQYFLLPSSCVPAQAWASPFPRPMLKLGFAIVQCYSASSAQLTRSSPVILLSACWATTSCSTSNE